jgi:hypothetical protein
MTQVPSRFKIDLTDLCQSTEQFHPCISRVVNETAVTITPEYYQSIPLSCITNLRAWLQSIRQTVMIWQALSGRTQSLRRQCHLLLASPMALSTVDRAALCWLLKCCSLWFCGWRTGVSSQSRHMYPLSTSSTPLIGLFGSSKASKRSDSRRTLESCALPGWRATT